MKPKMSDFELQKLKLEHESERLFLSLFVGGMFGGLFMRLYLYFSALAI